MTIQIQLSPDTEARLRVQAEAAGMDVRSFVLEALQEKLELNEGAKPDRPQSLSADEWGAELAAWAAGHPRLDYLADDRRDSIYAGRGE